MKLLTALIQPYMMDKLSRALMKAPISGYTVSEARGFGHGATDSTDYLTPRTRVEIALLDENLQAVVDLITHTAGTHQNGDGLIWVTELYQAIKIESGKEGSAAITR